MSAFGNLTETGLEETGDRLGGGGTIDSDVYQGKIKLAYLGSSATSASKSLNLLIDIQGQSFEYRETIWVIGKNGTNYSERDGKKIPLLGYTMANDLALLTLDKSLGELVPEEKVVNLWDFESRSEKPTNAQVFTELLGQDVLFAVQKAIVDKTQKDESTGKYNPTGETREENSIQKFFHVETGKTVTEIKNNVEEATFKDKWLEKNQGQVINRAKGAGKAGAPGGAKTPPTQGANKSSSLFNKS